MTNFEEWSVNDTCRQFYQNLIYKKWLKNKNKLFETCWNFEIWFNLENKQITFCPKNSILQTSAGWMDDISNFKTIKSHSHEKPSWLTFNGLTKNMRNEIDFGSCLHFLKNVITEDSLFMLILVIFYNTGKVILKISKLHNF